MLSSTRAASAAATFAAASAATSAFAFALVAACTWSRNCAPSLARTSACASCRAACTSFAASAASLAASRRGGDLVPQNAPSHPSQQRQAVVGWECVHSPCPEQSGATSSHEGDIEQSAPE